MEQASTITVRRFETIAIDNGCGEQEDAQMRSSYPIYTATTLCSLQ